MERWPRDRPKVIVWSNVDRISRKCQIESDDTNRKCGGSAMGGGSSICPKSTSDISGWVFDASSNDARFNTIQQVVDSIGSGEQEIECVCVLFDGVVKVHQNGVLYV